MHLHELGGVCQPPSEIPLLGASRTPPPELCVYDLKRPSPARPQLRATASHDAHPAAASPSPTGRLGSSPPARQLLRCQGLRPPAALLRDRRRGLGRAGKIPSRTVGPHRPRGAATHRRRLPSEEGWPGAGPPARRGRTCRSSAPRRGEKHGPL